MSGRPKTQATQTHFKFLPIATSDFIFAYNSERFGFIGSIFFDDFISFFNTSSFNLK